jgi:hypothetical protein
MTSSLSDPHILRDTPISNSHRVKRKCIYLKVMHNVAYLLKAGTAEQGRQPLPCNDSEREAGSFYVVRVKGLQARKSSKFRLVVQRWLTGNCMSAEPEEFPPLEAVTRKRLMETETLVCVKQ